MIEQGRISWSKASERKKRLFACNFCRFSWDRLHDERSRFAVEVAEGYVDGLANSPQLVEANRAAHAASRESGQINRRTSEALWMATTASSPSPNSIAASTTADRKVQLFLLEDLFGNSKSPSPSIAPFLLDWNNGAIPKIATAIYEERILPAGTFDPDRLAVLADALEQAGCTDADLLGHLRGVGPHVRGCWALDLVLGRVEHVVALGTRKEAALSVAVATQDGSCCLFQVRPKLDKIQKGGSRIPARGLVICMSQTLQLPGELYLKLAQGAAERGLSIESLLAFVSKLIVMPDRPTNRDRERSRRIERLLARYRMGPLTDQDRSELDQLIGADYQEANARADRLIRVKQTHSRSFKRLRK